MKRCFTDWARQTVRDERSGSLRVRLMPLQAIQINNTPPLEGAARPPVSLHVTRKPPTAPAPRELLLNGLHVSWPYVPRKFEEVPAGVGEIHQVLHERTGALGGIATPACGHYVAARVITTFHSRLHMVYT